MSKWITLGKAFRLAGEVASVLFNIVSGIQLFKPTVRIHDVFSNPIYIHISWIVLLCFVFSHLSEFYSELKRTKEQRAIIGLKDFDFETKAWKEGGLNIVGYIDVYSELNRDGLAFNANKVWASIIWKNTRTNDRTESNPGRWHIVSPEQHKTEDLQTVVLEANGRPKRLHYLAVEDRDQLVRAIWRKENGDYAENRFMGRDEQIVTIQLADEGNARAEYIFRITQYNVSEFPYDAYRMERINEEGMTIGKPQNIERAVLHSPEVLHRMRQRGIAELEGRST